MKATKTQLWMVLLTGLVCCDIMAMVDGLWQPGYAVKSAVKLAVFGLMPLITTRLWKLISFKELFVFRKKGFFTALGLGLGIYVLILGGYFALRSVFDFSQVAGSLT